jgi:hypothetical protein
VRFLKNIIEISFMGDIISYLIILIVTIIGFIICYFKILKPLYGKDPKKWESFLFKDVTFKSIFFSKKNNLIKLTNDESKNVENEK